ncbi:hypothetical protein OPT61_g1492 [Boeremia exigua]|uniref:Uncharacterized protein n=1 Tax=Boeremia exigua TaxID=749465 RepID=A0ACC2IQ89_9PLEO|nr:hypothetical protein OPT61_g1492 [Boeremia exigua]
MFIFAQSLEAPMVDRGPVAMPVSTPPVPPLFPLERLKQASGLGPWIAQVKWAWSSREPADCQAVSNADESSLSLLLVAQRNL